LDSPGHQYRKNAVAPSNCPLDDLSIVSRSWKDGDTPFERVEFTYAFSPTHANHLITTIQRMLNHVTPKLPGRAHDTYFFHIDPLELDVPFLE
jgi:hypothetical protein